MHKKYLLLFFLLLSVALLYSCSKQNEKAQIKSVNPNEYAMHKSKMDEHLRNISRPSLSCVLSSINYRPKSCVYRRYTPS